MRACRLFGEALVLRAEGQDGVFTATLPARAAGRWCRLRVRLPGAAAWWAKLEVTDPARGHVVREAFLGPIRHGARCTLLHVPRAATGLTLRLFGGAPGSEAPLGRVRVLSRPHAAWALMRQGWRSVPAALAGDRMGRLGRLRVVLGQAPARAGEAPDYTMWCALYDRWGEGERAALAACNADSPDIHALVLGADDAGRAASLASLAAQWLAPASIVCAPHDGPAEAAGAAWTLVLRAGDVLAPHALACLALQAGRHPEARLIFADVDILGRSGRKAPLLKPAADARLLRAGLITAGACLVRAGLDVSAMADCPAEAARGVPFVLTHLAQPLAPRPAPPRPSARPWPFVSIVIPTSFRSAHVERCLRRLLATTAYAGGFEVLLAVSGTAPRGRKVASRLARAARLPGVRVLHMDVARFNYAVANNRAVEQARGPLVLLLNDDVAPIAPDWLTSMALLHQDGGGIVGAKLLYGNGQVQHGGVIMGLAHLCEHAFRLARHDEPGPHGLALLDREVSAVTGACLLVGRDLYMSLGGMDESFAIALNDVDFCARARSSGARIVFAASVSLHHYEGLSLGRHYAGARGALESREVRMLRRRWEALIAADPFYHPAASLEPGREFQPGFPPRITPLSWIEGEAAAQG